MARRWGDCGIGTGSVSAAADVARCCKIFDADEHIPPPGGGSALGILDRPVRTAVNLEMVTGEFVVREDSEAAFFPPVTGG